MEGRTGFNQVKMALRRTSSWKYLFVSIGKKLRLPWAGHSKRPFNPSEQNRCPCDEKLLHQAEISRALLDAQERDRLRIASDLHDSIGQNLSVIKMTVESVENKLGEHAGHEREREALTTVLSRLRTTTEELRRIALGLRPSMLEELGLIPTIDWCCREFAETNPELTLVKHVGITEEDVPPSLRCDIYRVMQEAMHNISKHAKADNVELALERNATDLVLRISDDGCGFEAQGDYDAGIGLYSMQARSERYGGNMSIHSAAEAGTRIEFHWPLPSKKDLDEGGESERRLYNERRVRERRKSDNNNNTCSK